VTGKRSTVEVGSLRGRDASAAFDPRPKNNGECGRPLDDDWSIARERESVIQNLIAGEGEIEPRIEAAAVKLGVSRRQIYTWIGRYREAPRTSALLDKRSGTLHVDSSSSFCRGSGQFG
jgi:helix-turn-helix protein